VDADRGCRTDLGEPFAEASGVDCRRFSFQRSGCPTRFQQKAATNGSHTEAPRSIATSHRPPPRRGQEPVLAGDNFDNSEAACAAMRVRLTAEGRRTYIHHVSTDPMR
jgi:hypothetical protein